MPTTRHATASDAPVIASLLQQLGYDVPVDAIPGRLAAIAADDGIVIVAVDDDGQVAGLASSARFCTLHAGDRVAYITALVTDAAARQQGVGRTLVDHLAEWARSHGCTRLAVTSAEHRADAHAFYPRCGFPYTARRFTKLLDA